MKTASFLRANMIMVAVVMVTSLAQQLPSCGDERVEYSPFDNNFSDKMKSQPGPATVLIMGDKQFSPKRTRWMSIRKPDYMRAGPWTTAVWIRNSDRGVPEMLTFVDHGSGGVDIRWLNEKLLYGSVWWGRIVSTDFIFDFERREFIYREMTNYGQLIQPCRG